MAVRPTWIRHAPNPVPTSCTQIDWEVDGGHEFDYAITRGATYTLAASDSSAADQAQADDVCPGAAADVKIKAAYDALAAGQSLRLAPGTYPITTGLVFDTDYTSVFCEGVAIISTASDIDGVTVSAVVDVKGLHVSNSAASAKAGFKFMDGAKICNLYELWALGFEYGFHLSSLNGGAGVAYNKFYGCYSGSEEGSDLYVTKVGTGWVNENYFFGCNFHGGGTGPVINIADDSNNNIFTSCSFESLTAGVFTVMDHGMNAFVGCRLESAGPGFYVHNESANFDRYTRIAGCYMQVTGPLIAVLDGIAHVTDLGGFTGFIREDAGSHLASTTVDVQSLAGQAVLSVTATTGFYPYETILINSTEYARILSVQDGVSLTMWGNLLVTHEIAETVVTVGRRHGWETGVDANNANLYIYGQRAIQINKDGSITGSETDTTPYLVSVAQLDLRKAFVDSDGAVRIPGAEIRDASNANSYDALTSTHLQVHQYSNAGFTDGLGGTYVSVGETEAAAVGVMMDTSEIKRFYIRPNVFDLGTNPGRPWVICYDSAGAQISDDPPTYAAFNYTTYYNAGYGGSYTTGADNGLTISVTFHADVKSAFIGWGSGTNQADLVGLNIFVDSNTLYSEQCRTWFRYAGVKQPFPLRYSAAVPTKGGYNGLLWEVGDQVWHEDAATGEPMGWQVVFIFRTTLDGDEALGQTVLSVTNTTGVANDDKVGIMLDSGAMQWSNVDSFVADDTVTVHEALTGAAASGNAVVFFRFKAMANLA